MTDLYTNQLAISKGLNWKKREALHVFGLLKFLELFKRLSTPIDYNQLLSNTTDRIS